MFVMTSACREWRHSSSTFEDISHWRDSSDAPKTSQTKQAHRVGQIATRRSFGFRCRNVQLSLLETGSGLAQVVDSDSFRSFQSIPLHFLRGRSTQGSNSITFFALVDMRSLNRKYDQSISLQACKKCHWIDIFQNGTVITAQEGDSLSLTCLSNVSTSNIESAAKWKTSSLAASSFKVYSWPDKHPTTDNGHPPSFNESLVAQTITLDPLERSENPLKFECRSATNSESVTVDVTFPPTFTIRRVPGFGIPVVEGMRISLVRKS